MNTQFTQLIEVIENLESQVKELGKLANETLPKHEWLTTQEFAELTGLKRKTICNYIGRNKIKFVKKNEQGRHLIHIMELDKWTK
ncbi:helix-turn-helix domain-containing protein [Rhodohalobacter barkolensis]|uniref:Helix-turn-helix domain-containing protein n=1 Tax=Rhodohalobacter barkolensis TaxID=2053187 RepID=A0A2N0VHY1_9BACT|nr:helix-turn-helix domain-containing protein [Rhodohalobacter barkolensis]PKD43774.1 hypothetical protein CWD77_09450 [Rhodohalobacter barkolensis]